MRLGHGPAGASRGDGEQRPTRRRSGRTAYARPCRLPCCSVFLKAVTGGTSGPRRWPRCQFDAQPGRVASSKDGIGILTWYEYVGDILRPGATCDDSNAKTSQPPIRFDRRTTSRRGPSQSLAEISHLHFRAWNAPPASNSAARRMAPRSNLFGANAAFSGKLSETHCSL
jgi:hypothetical protein